MNVCLCVYIHTYKLSPTFAAIFIYAFNASKLIDIGGQKPKTWTIRFENIKYQYKKLIVG